MPIAEITRAETSRRAELLTVESYAVELDLTCGDKVFRSTSVIVFDCAEPGASSYADLIAEAVLEITLNGTPVDPDTACADGRIALPALAARNELRVVADCAYTADSKGMHRAVDSADGKIYCYSNFEPADARRVYANFEQPDLKAAFSFYGHRARSLDRAVQPARARAGASRRRCRWERDGSVALPADSADIDLPDGDRGR